MQKHVLVTGVGGPSGIAAANALQTRGFTVTAVDMHKVDHNADFFYQVPAAKDSAYLPALEKIIERHQIDWLFPTVSEELVLMAENAAHIRGLGVAIYVGTAQAVRICDDKWTTAQYLQSRHVAVPHGVIGGANDIAVAAIAFPKVSRPRVGRGGRGVSVHESSETLPGGKDLLWQKFLDGTEYDVLQVIHPDAPHATLASEVFEKTALREGKIGNAIDIIAVQAPDILELAQQAARAIGLFGPMDIDIRRDEHGKPYLLEINARIGAHTLRAPQIFDALVTLFHSGHLG